MRVFTKILLFLGFLPFFFLLPCPLSPENIFKNQQLVQRIFSQHTVQTSGTKKVYFFFSVFLHQIKKKERCLSSYITLHSSKIKMKKPTKRRAPPTPKMMCHRSKEPSVVCQSVLVTVSRLLQAHCGILPHTGSCQCCLGWV